MLTVQEAELLRPRVPALEAEMARLQVEVQDRNKGLRDAQNEEGLARAQVAHDFIVYSCICSEPLPTQRLVAFAAKPTLYYSNSSALRCDTIMSLLLYAVQLYKQA